MDLIFPFLFKQYGQLQAMLSFETEATKLNLGAESPVGYTMYISYSATNLLTPIHASSECAFSAFREQFLLQ